LNGGVDVQRAVAGVETHRSAQHRCQREDR
jgi:hypothetical protein